MKKQFLLTIPVLVSLVGLPMTAYGFSSNPERSLFIGFDIGSGLNPGDDARDVDSYSLGAFLFGINVGYRFNEIVGIEMGWHEQQHRAPRKWGGVAFYQVAHLAARLAWPNSSRFTPLLRVGPAFIGGFSYGSSSYGINVDNSSIILGGFTSLALELELRLGVILVLEAAYLPLYRFGMDGQLQLVEVRYDDGSNQYNEHVVDSRDFTEGLLVHLVWISAGFQFEWAFR